MTDSCLPKFEHNLANNFFPFFFSSVHINGFHKIYLFFFFCVFSFLPKANQRQMIPMSTSWYFVSVITFNNNASKKKIKVAAWHGERESNLLSLHSPTRLVYLLFFLFFLNFQFVSIFVCLPIIEILNNYERFLSALFFILIYCKLLRYAAFVPQTILTSSCVERIIICQVEKKQKKKAANWTNN